MRPTIKINPWKGGAGRYAILLVGLGAAGVAIGWAGPEAAAGAGSLIRRR
ncbi:hypothetical protein SAMN04489712_108112 [Thermomonospora echinospora]|uniref:Uncharacterized protein n=1 Tax=Thermomonospora echinospora TaxID=1992 RepID=A0A1H6BXT4_9ACTN|nr:hypothetical protein [Thermomonospora echinospora]SEG65524.1 hypothetical protein SAMN04489712_108112 [Thermomonospora echinospora]